MAAAAPKQLGLFGGEHRQRTYTSTEPANGYAASPGTGPTGETCGSCTSCRKRQARGGRVFYKCVLHLLAWTSGRGSDVLKKSPACAKWVAGKPTVTTIRTNPR